MARKLLLVFMVILDTVIRIAFGQAGMIFPVALPGQVDIWLMVKLICLIDIYTYFLNRNLVFIAQEIPGKKKFKNNIIFTCKTLLRYDTMQWFIKIVSPLILSNPRNKKVFSVLDKTTKKLKNQEIEGRLLIAD